MNVNDSSKWFDNVETVIVEPLKFKAKLSIGEDAYTSLRMKNKVFEAWDAFGVGATAVTVAQSSAVASTFFAPSGLLAVLGIGTAVTPIGWVISACVVSTGAWVGVSRYLKGKTGDRVTVIPEFINTPLDILGLALFDFIAPLALRLANIDGDIDQSEKQVISTYFISEWGYDPMFVDKGMAYTEANLADFSIKVLAHNLAEYKKENPDCNYPAMSKEILGFLNEIMLADGRIDEREEMAIDLVENIFSDVGKINIKKNIKEGVDKITNTIGGFLSKSVQKFK
ncbi:MAG: TerB family tellurite resistance protein [endosymbiont of Galathealinum brachiosum]|uniref:TerB family tellurite resistance protein n=1 Tax=endosymbiont of Galathealinum brachiosum TaxID=2200906 RepID=A0A370DDU6_9GAMM|nr:MAG: TerB family tellurite resistance protein [endosymbiont of Galathealinum brachiosum]